MRHIPMMLLALNACAAPQRKPCNIKAEISLVGPSDANTNCHAMGIDDDDNGYPIKTNDTLLGCAYMVNVNDNFLIVQDRADVMAHELRHLFERYCR